MSVAYYSCNIGLPCDINGQYLNADTQPEPNIRLPTDFTPYESRAQFELADFLFTRNQMAGSQIDSLMDILAAYYGAPPFASHEHLYSTIDSTTIGGAPWESFSVTYNGELPTTGEIPSWMTAEYPVWHRDPRTVARNQLGNPDFNNEIDYAPYQQFGDDGQRRWQNLMSANWSWKQAVRFLNLLCCQPLNCTLGLDCRRK